MIVYSLNKTTQISRQVSRLNQQNKTDLSELIAEEFGANAEYVQGLLERFRTNPDLVDDSWRSYFSEMLGGDGAAATQTSGNGAKATATAPPVAEADGDNRAARREITAAGPAPAPAPVSESKAVEAARPPADVEAIPLRGPALKIVENMESSLHVPTATSERRIPVKLLDENRRIINKHLAEHGRGKASYTRLIAFAMMRALELYPQLNDGYFN